MKFTLGQYVISNGTLYIYRHDCTKEGRPPRPHNSSKDGKAPTHCNYCMVNLPNSDKPIVMRRTSLQPVTDYTIFTLPLPIEPTPQKASTSMGRDAAFVPRAPKFDVLANLKADALDAQADRLEGYAKTLRDEAAALRRGVG